MAFDPANIPLTVWVGNHIPIIRGFKSTEDGVITPISLIGKDVFFTIFYGEGAARIKLIEKSTIAGTVSIVGDSDERMSVILTPADTRIIDAVDYTDTLGPKHEIEIHSGGVQETWIYGKVKIKGGNNVDT